jgi:ferredoxin-NADP reductase
MKIQTNMENWVLELEVVALRLEAEGVLSLELADPERRLLPSWKPGAHIDLHLPEVVRQYSLCGDPADRRAFRVAVLREPSSRGGSRYIHEQLRPGDRVEVGGPRNHFELVDAERYILIGGGIGITPLLPMVSDLAAAGRNWRLLYGGRTRRSMAFLPRLSIHGDRVEVCPEDEFGLLDLHAAIGPAAEGVAIYCCGPEGLLHAVEQRCEGWPTGALHVERFAARPVYSLSQARAFDLVLGSSGVRLTVPADTSALEVLEGAGVDLPSACREGLCGSCVTRVLSGVPEHRDSLTDPSCVDQVMPCVSRALSDELVLDL